MACVKDYPHSDTLVEPSMIYRKRIAENGFSSSSTPISTTAEDEVTPTMECLIRSKHDCNSPITNVKPYCTKKPSGQDSFQTKVLNGKNENGWDPRYKCSNHSSNNTNESNGTQGNCDVLKRNGHYSPTKDAAQYQSDSTISGKYNPDEHRQSNGITNGKHDSDIQVDGVEVNGSESPDAAEFYSLDNDETRRKASQRITAIPKGSTYLHNSNGIVETDSLTAEVLSDLFNDKICVLCIKNYTSASVCEKLDSFLRDKGSDKYTHEIRNNGRADLIYFGVNRYGFPLNSTYNDGSGQNLQKYLTEALPTIRSIRKASHPYLSPIDKFRVEMDEAWHKNVNVASLQGQKTFCGIGRIMPASLSELSAVQPHFDAVPTSYFPQIHKQFTANFYLNVPESGGELEIWDVSPISIDNIENFTIPENWRGVLPSSIKVKPERGDLLLFNTRRPHAITSFGGSNPRTSIQTFIGLAKNSEVFLWV